MVEMDPGVDIDTAELTEIPQARKQFIKLIEY